MAELGPDLVDIPCCPQCGSPLTILAEEESQETVYHHPWDPAARKWRPGSIHAYRLQPHGYACASCGISLNHCFLLADGLIEVSEQCLETLPTLTAKLADRL